MYVATQPWKPQSTEVSTNYEILLVDDSDDDAAFFQRASSKVGFPLRLRRADSADGAIRELTRATPDLIVLDCHMPGKDGLELLKELREMTHLNRTPIIMFSATRSNVDLHSAYRFGVNSFVVKALDYEESFEKVTSLIRYWLTVNCTDCNPANRR